MLPRYPRGSGGVETPQNRKAGYSLAVSGPYSAPSRLRDGLDVRIVTGMGTMAVPE